MSEGYPCKWCGRPGTTDGIGDYYHRKDCYRRDVIRRLDESDPTDAAGRVALLRELDRASNTGD